MTVATASERTVGLEALRVEGLKLALIFIGLVLLRWQPHHYFAHLAVRWPLIALEVAGGTYFVTGLLAAQLNLSSPRTEPRLSKRTNVLLSAALLLAVVVGFWGMAVTPVGRAVVALAGLLMALLMGAMLLMLGHAAWDWFKGRMVFPPGSGARRILGFVHSRKTMDLVFDPLLGDIQSEWLAHVVAGNHWHARAARVRGYVQLGITFAANGGASIIELAVKLYKIKKP